MQKQEAGEWGGGMLAVRLLMPFWLPFRSSDKAMQDEMGMGKTIQIISLLVSDRKKPNLVVA